MNETMPCREKYWEELTDSEKIEKLGNVLTYLKRIVDNQANLIQKLENHIHVDKEMYFRDGPVSPVGWPNNNPLNMDPSKTRKFI